MTWFQKKKAVVPIDFVDLSTEAVEAALEMIPDAANVHVIYVAPDYVMMEPGYAWETLADDTRRENLTAAFRKEFADAKFEKVQFHVAFGDPGHEITAYAEEIGAGIVIMPSHGRTGLKRIMIGSVAERVVRLAHCPVLVLRS